MHALLSLIIWLPAFGAVVCLVANMGSSRPELTRWIAFGFALATLGLCIPIYEAFNPASYHMQLVESYHWIPALGIKYSLGIDGISLLFIMLNCFTTLLIILAAWRSVKTKIGQYMAVFLFTEAIMNGAFSATDAMLFYMFFEASLIPMYLGIGVWGGARRSYAAVKLFLYTFLGSIFLLVALLFLHDKAGTFNIQALQNVKLTTFEEDLVFLGFLAAFAVKIPMWPVHTWLPDAHTEAPAGGSVILAALLLKLGAYGFIRFSLPIVPHVNASVDWLMIGLSLIAVIYVGLASVAQTDMKRLIAYSSISHMGIVTLGIFMVFMIVGHTHDPVDAMVSVQGAVFQMVAHGFSSGALFLCVGYLYDRFSSRAIKDYQGIAHSMPLFAAFFMLFALANVGLPGTSGFVGEFLVILSAFKANVWVALGAGMTLIIAPAYTLWLYKRVLFGSVKKETIAKAQDIKANEILVCVLIAIPVIVLGIYPEPLLHISHAASMHFVNHVIAQVPIGSY